MHVVVTAIIICIMDMRDIVPNTTLAGQKITLTIVLKIPPVSPDDQEKKLSALVIRLAKLNVTPSNTIPKIKRYTFILFTPYFYCYLRYF